MAAPEKIKLPDIKFDAKSMRLMNKMIDRLDILIALLIKERADATQEQDSGIPSGVAGVD